VLAARREAPAPLIYCRQHACSIVVTLFAFHGEPVRGDMLARRGVDALRGEC